MRILVARAGLDACFEALSRVRDEGSLRPRSAEFAVETEGRFITETSGERGAILWFIPDAADAAGLDGLGAWIPRSRVVDLCDPMLERRDPLGPAPPRGVIRTHGAVEWRKAMRIGSTVRFLDERRRSA
jgi:hypothetical protein